MMVSVTRGDIARGRRDDCYGCPVALALRRHTGRRVAVGQVALYMHLDTPGQEPIVTFAPPAVAEFVCRFDGGEKVAPFTFRTTLARRK